MRVALVAEDYYPQLGGVPEHVHNLALQLNSWGHTATVISSHMGSYPDAAFVRRVGTSRVIYSNGGVSRITTGWGSGVSSKPCSAKAATTSCTCTVASRRRSGWRHRLPPGQSASRWSP